MPAGRYRIVVHVCIFDDKARMVIQKRQDTVDVWSGRWDLSVGGSVIAGETSHEAAARETREELGLCFDLSHVMPAYTVYFREGFDDIYMLLCKADLSRFTLQKEEVQGIQWATEDAICAMIDNGSFVPYDKNLIHLLFSAYARKLPKH